MAERPEIEATRRILANLAKAAPLLAAIVEDMQIAAEAFIAREEKRATAGSILLAQAREMADEDGENHPAAGGSAPVVATPAPLHLAAPLERPAIAPLSPEDQARVDLAKEDPNPYITQDPKAWIDRGGESMKGARMGECPPEYLDLMAAGLDKRAAYWAKQGDAAKEAADKRQAALAREHAARQRPEPPRTQHSTISAEDILNGRKR